MEIYSTIYEHGNCGGKSLEGDASHSLALRFGGFLTYYTLALVPVGSVGNILSVIAFFNTKLRNLSSSYYLAALSISNTGFLLGAFIAWLNYLDIDIDRKIYYCQFYTYTSGLFNFLSVWIMVSFTVERFIAVIYPLKRRTMCTVKRARAVLIGLTCVGSVVNVPYFIYAAPRCSHFYNDFPCDASDEYKVRKS